MIREIFSSSLSIGIFVVLITGFIIQLIYYLLFYAKFAFGKAPQPSQEAAPPVSVIITARNEARNLERFLPGILEQDYPDYEVIVVNHASTDDTDIVLQRMKDKYPKLYVTKIPYSPASNHTKKLALTIGIKAAKNDVLLFTDADCRVVSKNWIRKMVRHYDDKTKIVLGYGGYERKKGFLDKWIRTDTSFIAMQYFGFALRGLPYMGVGRNLSWKKSFFESQGGFQSHFFEPSGSDDIFVNNNATGQNTKSEYDPQSFTRSVQPERWKEWMLMKKRHYGSTKFYKFKFKLLLSIEPLSRLAFYFGTLFFLLINFNYWILFIFFMREIVMLSTFYISTRKLKETNLWWFILIYDPLQPFINLVAYLDKNRKKRWT